MNALLPPAIARRGAFFRTPVVPVVARRRPFAMPAWHGQPLPPEAGRIHCTHSYGAHGASTLCGTAQWRELVPPDEATCPACRTRLGRGASIRVH